ncbi:MAG: hypothetical protein AAB906_05070, partial [Patescibacteria group bacterium]
MINEHDLAKCDGCPLNGDCPIQMGMRISERITKMIETYGDGALDRMFRRPDVFKLVQSYEILSGIGEKFDLRKEYYSEVLSNMPDAAREKFEENLLLGDSLMFMIRSLILQRADQLAKAAIDGICTRDGVCHNCWINE